jgi:hypothetical protein
VRLEEDVRGFIAGDVNQGDISRFYFFSVAFDQLMKEGVTGDVAELGTYKGNTATLLAKIARRMGTTAWILDTFEGFEPADLTGPDAGQKIQFQDTSLEAVRALVGEENVRYVKGYFPDSATQMPDDLRFALVHIDCDLYIPISHALRYFYPRLLPGGYLIVHDYASLAWEGAERAVDEFFVDKPEAVIPLTDGGGSVVIRKNRETNWLLDKRRRLISDKWTFAADNALGLLLGSGWSGPEPWGVWGIGDSHTIRLYLETVPASGITVHIMGSAALVASRTTQQIDVLAGGKTLKTWEFAVDVENREQVVSIPAALAITGPEGPMFEIEFRPRSVVSINKLQPNSPDDRALGLALKAIRVTPTG